MEKGDKFKYKGKEVEIKEYSKSHEAYRVMYDDELIFVKEGTLKKHCEEVKE